METLGNVTLFFALAVPVGCLILIKVDSWRNQ
jgi:hypothetical protein